jgi:outer membrane protein assembly factor BamB
MNQGCLWVSGDRNGRGRLAVFHTGAGSVDTIDLPASHIAYQLAGDGETIFVGCNDVAGIPAMGKTFMAFDAKTGQLFWQHRHSDVYTLSPAGYGDGKVSYLTDQGILFLRDAASGELLRRLLVGTGNTRFAPLIDDRRVVIVGGMSQQGKPALLAVDYTTETIQWEFRSEGPVIYPPAANDGMMGVGLANDLFCLDRRDGQIYWRGPFRPPRVTSRGALTSPALIASDQVMVGGGDWY